MKKEEVVKKLMEYIKTLEEGTEVSTSELMAKVYGDCFDIREDDELLADIDYQLYKACEKEGIILDKSKYNRMLVGLPYNIPFVIRYKNKSTK